MSVTASELREFFHYDPDTGIFTRLATKRSNGHLIGKPAGNVMPIGYLAIRINKRLHYCHRLAWLYMHGYWPERAIDHIDGDRGNNRLSNLRLATMSRNIANGRVRSNNTSGVPGVFYGKRERKWIARVRYQYKTIHVGTFNSLDEARDARNAKAQELWGAFARVY